MASQTIVVVGGGIFGVTAALELRRRGYHVQLLDPGPLPHPLAESTDISKAVRLDYGPDEDYMALMETALAGWREWNSAWPVPLFHEEGVTYLARAEMQPGGFEYESFHMLEKRGHRPERLSSREIAGRFPAWNASLYVDGYYNPQGGFAQSGKVVAQLIAQARAGGVELYEGQAFDHFLEGGSRVAGVATRDGSAFPADTGTRRSRGERASRLPRSPPPTIASPRSRIARRPP
jgi:glycine/D-amino acid oxidase-like deaminating enzyme